MVANLSKGGWTWAASPPWILAGEQSPLPMRTAATEGISLSERMQVG